MKLLITGTAFCFVLITTMTMADDLSGHDWALERIKLGEKLFYDPTLGGSTNELSCNSCHKGGRRLEHIAANAGLMRGIRRCLVNHMGGVVGEPKSGRDVHIVALRMYILSLSGEALIPPKHSPPDRGGFSSRSREYNEQ